MATFILHDIEVGLTPTVIAMDQTEKLVYMANQSTVKQNLEEKH